ncbi:hypothetical protein GF1_14140 [Desulfolithobacter dissulfuricans]|uniref:Uncharacterized protein n=1 Tax=Desulfolithobacter dissulfuricans TaxID=2795293 RepID=A0A915U022_9BACT|nr:hypothetical protein GF1_14140 [Desulfolithobacter dissulfuricans]
MEEYGVGLTKEQLPEDLQVDPHPFLLRSGGAAAGSLLRRFELSKQAWWLGLASEAGNNMEGTEQKDKDPAEDNEGHTKIWVHDFTPHP